MKQRMQQKSPAAQAQVKLQQQMQLNNQKAHQKAPENEQTTDLRIKRDITLEAFRANDETEATEGVPSAAGLKVRSHKLHKGRDGIRA